MPDSIVLDTSSVMAILSDEPEGARASRILFRAATRGDTLLMPFVVLTEVEYLLMRRHGPSEAHQSLAQVEAWPIEVIESDRSWRTETARIKAAGNISFADAWVAALGIIRDAAVLHKDPQFQAVAGLKTIDIRRANRDG